MKEKSMRTNYVSPQINLESVELESGIATGSKGTIVPGGPSDNDSPSITDWKVQEDNENIKL